MYGCATHNTVTEAELDPSFLKQEYILLSDEYFAISKYDKALDFLLKANNIAPDNALDYKIARTAAFAKQWDISSRYYNLLLEKDSGNLAVQKSLAWVLAQSGHIEESCNLFEKLYANSSWDAEIVKNYVLVLLALENITLAQSVLDEYAVLNPTDKIIAELADAFPTKN